jgi:hypothetical protein
MLDDSTIATRVAHCPDSRRDLLNRTPRIFSGEPSACCGLASRKQTAEQRARH